MREIVRHDSQHALNPKLTVKLCKRFSLFFVVTSAVEIGWHRPWGRTPCWARLRQHLAPDPRILEIGGKGDVGRARRETLDGFGSLIVPEAS